MNNIIAYLRIVAVNTLDYFVEMRLQLLTVPGAPVGLSLRLRAPIDALMISSPRAVLIYVMAGDAQVLAAFLALRVLLNFADDAGSLRGKPR